MTIKTPQEIEILTEGGKKLASVLTQVASFVKPGISTKELNDMAFDLIKEEGGKPAFLNYSPPDSSKRYPASLCVSINDEVVHGIPSAERILEEGDIVSMDLGLEYRGLFTDTAVTVGVGKISAKDQELLDITKQGLKEGIAVLRPGVTLGDYGFAVQSFVEDKGFSVVRNLVGHGVGYEVHEEPDIPNWGRKGKGMILEEGMILALEPMVCTGEPEVVLDSDNWTWKTKDGLKSAHFEHTIVVEKDGARVLTLS
ncbi:MAG: type I methionyl aminopeptidase [Patescibacteria group bacterium]